MLWSQGILPICNPVSIKLTCYQSSLTAQDGSHSTEQGCPSRGGTVCLVSDSSLAALIALVLKTSHVFRHACNSLFILMKILVLANVFKLVLAVLQKQRWMWDRKNHGNLNFTPSLKIPSSCSWMPQHTVCKVPGFYTAVAKHLGKPGWRAQCLLGNTETLVSCSDT